MRFSNETDPEYQNFDPARIWGVVDGHLDELASQIELILTELDGDTHG